MNTFNLFPLVLGPSGVGKSTIIKLLCEKYSNIYGYIKPYTTRNLRPDETDKFHIESNKFEELVLKKEIIVPTNLYGNKYGPLRRDIYNLINDSKIPIIDWHVKKVDNIKKELEDLIILGIYLMPPNLETLSKRLRLDIRNNYNLRYISAILEISFIKLGFYKEHINIILINKDNQFFELMEETHVFIQSFL